MFNSLCYATGDGKPCEVLDVVDRPCKLITSNRVGHVLARQVIGRWVGLDQHERPMPPALVERIVLRAVKRPSS